MLENIQEMANAVSVPATYILERGQQVKVFSLIARKARQQGFLIPDDKSLTHEGKYDGATVLDAKKGAYFDPVATLDFASREFMAAAAGTRGAGACRCARRSA